MQQILEPYIPPWHDYTDYVPWQEQLQNYPLESGIRLSIENFSLKQAFSIAYKKIPADCFECIYCLSGRVIFETDKRELAEDSLPVSCISWQSCGEGVFSLGPACPVQVIHIYFTHAALIKYLGDGALVAQFVRFFAAKNRLIGRVETISPMVESLVYQIIHCPLDGVSRRLFFHAKVVELLALEVDLWTSRHQKKIHGKELFFTSDEITALEKARNILLHQYQEPPSLQELARRIGFNKNKLNAGFRQLFGSTVYSALTVYRMEKAKQMLDSGERNVSETAIAVGYINVGHFSRLFHKYYGVLPGNYLRNIKILRKNRMT